MNELVYCLFAAGSAFTGTYLSMKGIREMCKEKENEVREERICMTKSQRLKAKIGDFFRKNKGKIYIGAGAALLLAPSFVGFPSSYQAEPEYLRSGEFLVRNTRPLEEQAAIIYFTRPTHSTRLPPEQEMYLGRVLSDYVNSLKTPIPYFLGVLAGVALGIKRRIFKE
jgi:hypothetical protein